MKMSSTRVATGSWMQCDELASHSSSTGEQMAMETAGIEQSFSSLGGCQWT